MKGNRLSAGVGRSRFLLLLLLLSLFACGPERAKPMIDVTLDHPDNSSATVTMTGQRALIDVTDPRGINGLNATLVEGEWPQEVVVRLRLRGLESLEITYGDIRLATGRSSNDSPDPPLMLTVIDEDGQAQAASPSADIYYPAIEQTADGFEISLPPHFYRENPPAFSMQWIDFYRQ